MTNPHWWRDAVIYQIYPRSFADSDGDGYGDLEGIIARLDHVRDLGVDAIWCSPFYASPMKDAGYDVSDYMTIDPLFGGLDAAERLVEACHARGLKLIVDLVPNHTSSEHAWFRAALAAEPGSPERGRYHFADGKGADGELPPNNWTSVFGGPGGPASPSPTARPSSGTSTSSTSPSPTSTGTTSASARASTRSSGSGSTAASTGSASTWRTRS